VTKFVKGEGDKVSGGEGTKLREEERKLIIRLSYG
jgi:hypothetical protein